MSFQGHIEKGMVILDRPLPLPDGTPVLVEPVGLLSDFWQSYSLDDLAKRQGVPAPGRLEDLYGGWPVEERDDDFEQAFRTWRESELEKHP